MTKIDFRILNIDLASRRSWLQVVSQETLRAFVGGANMAARILYPDLVRSLDPLGSDAPILFLAGPLTGTIGPAVGRFVICAKSPATGLWGESNCGGFFGPEMRAAGHDGLLLRGSSEAPVYLWISEEGVEFKPADEMWGSSDTYETQARIRDDLGDPLVRVASIGLAGESQLPMALVLCDHGRMAGRTGMGAVLGSKNVKAVAVRGRKAIPLAEPARFRELRKDVNKALRNDTVSRALRSAGTAAAADLFNFYGLMPKRYYTSGVFEGVDRVTGATMEETILSGVSACHGCVIACGRRVKLSDGYERKGPEYETIAGFGPNLWIDDLAAITRLGELCDQLGMDTISVSNTIGLAMLMYHEGILTKEDTGGLAIEWGDVGVVEKLVGQMARSEGFGAELAGGARDLANRHGVGEMAAQVNGLEMAYHDPRASSGMALVYATSPRGGCHNQSDYFMVDLGQSVEEVGVGLMKRQGGAEKAENVARHQDWRSVGSALVLCKLASVSPDAVRDLVNAATGFDYTLQELMDVGERGWTLKRAINIRLGLKPHSDRLPGIVLKPLAEGGTDGFVPPMDELLRDYYRARDWDPATGKPNASLLERLDLEFASSEIWN